MRSVVAAVVVALAGLLLPWQTSVEAMARTTSSHAVTRAVARPARLAAGETATIEARVLTRRPDPVTVEATVQTERGQVVWQQTWADQTLARGASSAYVAAWTAPANQPAGRYRLVVRVLNPAGREVAKPRRTTLTLTAARGAAPAPPAAPAPAPTPAPSPPAYPFAITGSPSFVANIRAGLELMRAVAPEDYAVVAGNLTEIREGPQNYAWGGSRAVQISAASAGHSRGYAGAIVLHEAVHVRNWFANDQPVFGCDGEAKSLRAQASYLRKAGDPALAGWVESLIGAWC
jgi:hypothetical protein